MGYIKVLNSINKFIIEFLTFLSLFILFFTFPFILDKGIPKDPIILISLFIPLIGIIWVVLFYLAEKKINLENNFFLVSSLINILLVLGFILLLFITIVSYNFYDKFFTEYLEASSPLIQNLPWIIIIALSISFLIFIVGYIKNKK